MNWRKIKAEYISGKESQRALAEKYGVSRSTLIRRANKEHWTQKRKAAETETEKKVQQKTAEIVSDNAVLMERAKTGLLLRVVRMIEDYPDSSAAEIKRKQNGALLKYSMILSIQVSIGCPMKPQESIKSIKSPSFSYKHYDKSDNKKSISICTICPTITIFSPIRQSLQIF